jgi:preprotein translocase subunit SecF
MIHAVYQTGYQHRFHWKTQIAFVLSLLMILVSIGTLIMHKGPRYGIDFAGGTLVQVKFEAPVTIDGSNRA